MKITSLSALLLLAAWPIQAQTITLITTDGMGSQVAYSNGTLKNRGIVLHSDDLLDYEQVAYLA